jgi:hypothetical protein
MTSSGSRTGVMVAMASASRLFETAAATIGRILRVARADRHVGDLAGGAVRPAAELAVDHQGETDAGTNREQDEIAQVATEAEIAFGKRRQVDVVLEGDVRAELLTHRLHQAVASPARKVGCHGDVAARGVEDARAADARLGHLRPFDPRLTGEAVGDGTDLADQRALAGDAGPLVATGDDAAADVGDRRAHPLAPDIDAHHPAGGRVDFVEQGAGTPIAARAAHLADQL